MTKIVAEVAGLASEAVGVSPYPSIASSDFSCRAALVGRGALHRSRVPPNRPNRCRQSPFVLAAGSSSTDPAACPGHLGCRLPPRTWDSGLYRPQPGCRCSPSRDRYVGCHGVSRAAACGSYCCSDGDGPLWELRHRIAAGGGSAVPDRIRLHPVRLRDGAGSVERGDRGNTEKPPVDRLRSIHGVADVLL